MFERSRKNALTALAESRDEEMSEGEKHREMVGGVILTRREVERQGWRWGGLVVSSTALYKKKKEKPERIKLFTDFIHLNYSKNYFIYLYF